MSVFLWLAALTAAACLAWDAADRVAWNRLDRTERAQAERPAEETGLRLDFFFDPAPGGGKQ